MQSVPSFEVPALEFPTELPLFLLPEHVLLPGLPTPYRVFEDRYRDLVRDLLDRPEGERWLAMPCLVGNWRELYYGRPDFEPVATAALLASAKELDSGHFHILVVGSERCDLEEIATDKRYRVARACGRMDEPSQDAEVQRGIDALLELSLTMMTLLGPAARILSVLAQERSHPELLVDRLATVVLHDAPRRKTVLEERSVQKRIEYLLSAMADIAASAAMGGLQ